MNAAAQHAGPNGAGWVVIILVILALGVALALAARNRKKP